MDGRESYQRRGAPQVTPHQRGRHRYPATVPRRSLAAVGTVVAAAVLLVVSALPAWAAQAITLTWVRHAQSTANAAGIIDTTVPGPGLTALGDSQAQAIAETLKVNAYDGI